MKKNHTPRTRHTHLRTFSKGASLLLLLKASFLSAQAETLYGVSATGNLFTFDSNLPGIALTSTPITGNDGFIRDIAFHAGTRQLFGLDNNNSFYQINTASGVAQKVAHELDLGFPFTTGFSYNSSSGSFQFLSDEGLNASVNPSGSITLGSPLQYASDDLFEGFLPFAAGLTFANNQTGYLIDSELSTLSQSTALSSGIFSTIGDLGVFISSDAPVGFSTGIESGQSFASFSTDGVSYGLYDINLNTGQASLLGTVLADDVLLDIAAAPVPEPAHWALSLSAIMLSATAYLRKRKNKI